MAGVPTGTAAFAAGALVFGAAAAGFATGAGFAGGAGLAAGALAFGVTLRGFVVSGVCAMAAPARPADNPTINGSLNVADFITVLNTTSILNTTSFAGVAYILRQRR